MPRWIRAYVRIVDAINHRIGRFAMYLLFAMMAVLGWSSLSKVTPLPANWTLQTGELDGVAWSGITEDYTVGWADVTKYYLTNPISGAWIGHFFANMDRWNEVPPHLQVMLQLAMDSSHLYRQRWYWAGEADLRVNGPKLQLTTIPDAEWKQVQIAAEKFWEEIAAESETKAKVIAIFKEYNGVINKAGFPYGED